MPVPAFGLPQGSKWDLVEEPGDLGAGAGQRNQEDVVERCAYLVKSRRLGALSRRAVLREPHRMVLSMRCRRTLTARGMFMAVAKQGNKPRKPSVVSEREGANGVPGSGRGEQHPTDLHMATRSSLADLAPGEIVFLDDFAYLRESFAPHFFAVLACPLCGAPGLITSAQYSSGAPIVCMSKVCSGLFRIVGEAQIVALPPS